MSKKSNKTEHVMRLITKDPDGVIDQANRSSEVVMDASDNDQTQQEKQEDGRSVIKKPDMAAAMNSESDKRQDRQDMTDLVRDIPDGVPFERRNEDIITDVLDSANKAGMRQETLEEAKVSIRQEELIRAEKIELVDQIIKCGDQIINLSESLTIEIMPSIIKRLGGCNCQMCTLNIMALTLNMLPPRYVTTNTGKQYMKLLAYKSQHELDVIQAITKACLKVMANPRHGTEEE